MLFVLPESSSSFRPLDLRRSMMFPFELVLQVLWNPHLTLHIFLPIFLSTKSQVSINSFPLFSKENGKGAWRIQYSNVAASSNLKTPWRPRVSQFAILTYPHNLVFKSHVSINVKASGLSLTSIAPRHWQNIVYLSTPLGNKSQSQTQLVVLWAL